jgi:hypothetical protein
MPVVVSPPLVFVGRLLQLFLFVMPIYSMKSGYALIVGKIR